MQLIHGDCLVEMQKIPDHSVDMILCDLPYGTTGCSWDVVIPFEPLWVQYKRIRKEKCPIVLFGSEPFSTLLRMSNFNEYKYDWIWDKGWSNSFQLSNIQPLKWHENISIFGEGKIIYNPQMKELRKFYDTLNWSQRRVGKTLNSNLGSKDSLRKLYTHNYPHSVIEEFNAQGEECNNIHKLHPTQKPISLLEYLIKTYTNEGDLVLDNCIGSGSTGIACLNTNRDFIGIELYPLPDKPISKQNPDYFNIAKNRIAKWKFEPTYNEKEEQINLF